MPIALCALIHTYPHPVACLLTTSERATGTAFLPRRKRKTRQGRDFCDSSNRGAPIRFVMGLSRGTVYPQARALVPTAARRVPNGAPRAPRDPRRHRSVDERVRWSGRRPEAAVRIPRRTPL